MSAQAQAIVTTLQNPVATDTGFAIDATVAFQDATAGMRTVDIILGLPLTGAASGWKAQIVNAVIQRSVDLGFSGLVAARVNVPSFTTG